MARVLALILVSSVATNVFEVFDNRTLSIEYHRRLAVIPHEKMREVGAVSWQVGRLARRLTNSSANSSSDECETACKDSLEPFLSDFQAIGEAVNGLSEESQMKHIGDMMACMYQALCKHKGAFTCMANTDACKDVITESEGDSDTSLATLNSQMQCLCDDCPDMIQGMAGMMQVFIDVIRASQQGSTDADKVKKDLLDGVCPLVPAIECAEEKASCKTDNAQMEGVLGAFKEGEGDTQEDEVKKLKEGCEAEGATMALPETAKYVCDNIPGLDIEVSFETDAAHGIASAGIASLAVLVLAGLS